VGTLDLFAKQTFAEETEGVTHGAIAWEMPPELNLSEVRLDGMLLVRDQALLTVLPAPWCEAWAHDEIVLEIKMPGDHLGVKAMQRTLLRRQAWQVQRVEAKKPAWRGEVPLWMVAPRVPAMLRALRTLSRVATGCYSVTTGSFSFLWIAANELPLREELIPFLIARSGSPLVEFARWVVSRRSPEWALRMVQIVPMSTTVREELLRYIPQTDDPGVRERQRHVAKVLVDMNPDLRDEWLKTGVDEALKKGRDQGILRQLVHLFERRLGRSLTEAEHQMLHDRLARVGPDRLDDVVLDLAPDALAAWLADPTAT
jgi:hypothetical protein